MSAISRAKPLVFPSIKEVIAKTHLVLFFWIALSLWIGSICNNTVDFRIFYDAGKAALNGMSPYSLAFFNPVHAIIVFAPLSLLPYDVASHLWSALMFGAYVLACYRIIGKDYWIAALMPFGLILSTYGNFDSLVLLGGTLPAPIGVFLLISKPQIGLFAAGIMIWKYRSWRLTLAVIAVLVISLSLGMIHGGLNTNASLGIFPFGLIVGLPLLFIAWKRKDALIGVGASVFISPYITLLNLSAAIPLLRNRKMLFAGLVLSWVIYIITRINMAQ